jgi:hypothetical protein
MSHQTVVKRGGFLSAVAYGFFGLLIAVIVCGAGVGIYALNVVDRKVDTVIALGTGAIRSLPEVLPEVRDALPPALADALNDVRDPTYRDSIELDVRVAPSQRTGKQHLVINARNNGERTVSLMAVRVVLVDEEGVPSRAIATYVATPLTIDHDWRGPILPGSLRQCSVLLSGSGADLTPQVEITDLRVWQGPEAESGNEAVDEDTEPSPVPN